MDKATLIKKSVLALERLAKKVGAKTVTPDGKKKNKTQLVNSIVMKERLSGKTLGAKPAAKKQTGKSNIAKDKARKALSPGQRVSAKGKKYYEYRRNRSDVPGTLLGENQLLKSPTYKYPSQFRLIKNALEKRKYAFVFFNHKGQEYVVMPNKYGNDKLTNITKESFEKLNWIK